MKHDFDGIRCRRCGVYNRREVLDLCLQLVATGRVSTSTIVQDVTSPRNYVEDCDEALAYLVMDE